MADVPVGQRAANLPWLCPAGASLLALTDEQPNPNVLAADPAVVLLYLRYVRPTPQPTQLQLDEIAFGEPVLADAAARFLSAGDAPRLDLTNPTISAILELASRSSRTAAELARQTGFCAAPAAAVAGLLASLGWLSVAAIQPDAVVYCAQDIEGGIDPSASQTKYWGMNHDGIVRRVSARWRLPHWLTAVVANLGLSVELACQLGADRGLFTVVRAAVEANQQAVIQLGLTTADDAPGDVGTMRLAESLANRLDSQPLPLAGSSELPASTPFLIRLLRTSARARRVDAAGPLARLHEELDRTHDRLRATGDRFNNRVRDAKLVSLAELAAGAGHEINNPLAVISGNAQRLQARLEDPEARKPLEAIVRQSRRIAEIISDLMLFARPRPPVERTFRLGDWINEVLDEFRPLAAVKGVELQTTIVDSDVVLHADPRQLARALVALLRNAVDAAGADGWVRITTGQTAGKVITVGVEDCGPGPAAGTVEHLFDPFFSGRSAGRGRGLGLSVAWRLARENGGDIRFAPLAGGPTRFVLELPRSIAGLVYLPDRKSA